MSTKLYVFLAVIISAAVTFALRVAPFAFFRNREMSPRVQKTIKLLPAAIIAVLVIYCLKGLPVAGLTEVIITLASCAVVVALHLWKNQTLLSIAGGTVIYMILYHTILM